MKLGVLETGKVASQLSEKFGAYPQMFERLLREAAARSGFDLSFEVHSLLDGAPLPEIGACDAWLVTGSRHGVYDNLPWIAPLRGFLRRAHDADAPLIGVCFGHQILAEALGGRAEKSERGWGLGVHNYEIVSDHAWMGVTPFERMDLHAVHQDQVTIPPPGARTLAQSEFCPFAALAYGPEAAPTAISIQAHPEFQADFVDALITLRTGDGFPVDAARAGQTSLGAPVANAAMADWMIAFLCAAQARDVAERPFTAIST
ncbi:MAG: type 1 glutamine amidotransferase [Rhodobacteraceae bacterium]|nr:type 1 glutamine amidotransferase [Paracoccaceae bacterium]